MKRKCLSASEAFELMKSVNTKAELVNLAKEHGMDLDEERAEAILKEFGELEILDEERIAELNGGCCADYCVEDCKEYVCSTYRATSI